MVADDLFPRVQIAARGQDPYFPPRRAVRANPGGARGGRIRPYRHVERRGGRARAPVAAHLSESRHALRRDGMDLGDQHGFRRHIPPYSRRRERKGQAGALTGPSRGRQPLRPEAGPAWRPAFIKTGAKSIYSEITVSYCHRSILLLISEQELDKF